MIPLLPKPHRCQNNRILFCVSSNSDTRNDRFKKKYHQNSVYTTSNTGRWRTTASGRRESNSECAIQRLGNKQLQTHVNIIMLSYLGCFYFFSHN